MGVRGYRWTRVSTRMSRRVVALEQQPVGAGDQGDREACGGAFGHSVQFEANGSVRDELEVAHTSLLDRRMGHVRAGGHTAAQRRALMPADPVELELGDAVAGMAARHEVAVVPELTG